ncbi:MAG: sugar ABC transporter permease [Eubacteriales bacterium]|nr:sugar ABC transporter permease [Eubacteriales bacterium]
MKKGGYFQKKKLTFFAFVLPGAVFMAVMIIYPIIYNIVMSFKDVNIMNFATGDSKFIGLSMYKDILHDKVTWIAIKNTLLFTVWCLLFQFPIGFAMALFFSKRFKLAPTLRGINVIAWMIPMVAVAGVFKYMFNSDVGIVNRILMGLHLISSPVEWLAHGNTALAAIVVANIWKGVPFNMILLATALTTLPADIYESASIDGANKFQQFFLLTVPLLKPAIISVLTLGFIYTFKVFDLVYVMTGGGPGSATEMLSTLAYRYSFAEYNFSQGAAIANVLFVLLMIVGFFYIHITLKEDKEDVG